MRGDPAAYARRDALRVYAWQHFRANPAAWFSVTDLDRVIRQRYVCDPMPPSVRNGGYGRSQQLYKVLDYLAGRDEIVSRPHPARKGSLLWQWAG